jgi:hypothetical protein
MRLWVSYKKKIWKFFFASSKSRKKGVRFGSISQEVRIRRYGSAPKCHWSPTLSETILFYINAVWSCGCLVEKNHTVSTGSRLPASQDEETTNDREGNCEQFWVRMCRKIRLWDRGSGIRNKPIPDPGSRGQKGTGFRIPDPNPQHFLISN